MKDKVVVFDVLGPGYHYDPKGWEGGAVGPLVELIEQHKDKIPFEVNDLESESKAEQFMLEKGITKPLITEGFVDTVLYLQEKKVVPVIVSAGTTPSLGYFLEQAAREYSNATGQLITPESLFRDEHVISTVDNVIGNKKTPEVWVRAAGDIGKSIMVFEDTYANLRAATKGLKAAGYYVVFRSNEVVKDEGMSIVNGTIVVEDTITVGSMKYAKQTLAERL